MGRLATRLTRLVFVISLMGLVIEVARELSRCAQIHSAYLPAPNGMVLVPAGYFSMGSNMAGVEANEGPSRDAFTGAFYIDQYEITNAQFQAFDRSHRFPEGHENWPVTGIYKHRAEAYAAHYGKRLPTAAEWEKAARGNDGRRYP